MRIRKYLVDTMPEALIRIRKDLGSDAVILDQKKIKVGGFLGFFRKEKLEVTAVVEPSNKRYASNSAQKNSSSTTLNNKTEQSKPVIKNEETTKTTKQSNEETEKPIETIEKLKIEHISINDQQAQTPNVIGTDNNADMMTELKSLKDMFVKMMIKNEKEDFSFSGKDVYQHLINNEIDGALATDLVAKVVQTVGPTTPISKKHLFELLRKDIEKIFSKYVRKSIKTNKQKTYAFVGPTGVGKTTTIAKLAAYYALEKKLSVGFITLDTYRIAAVDQLKTYANILNIPVEIVFNHKDIESSLRNLQNCDVILIDTAGRNFRHDVHCNELSQLLNIAKPDEVFIVLSMTTKQKDMIEITESLSKVNFNSFIFTKLDETTTYGSILNIINRFEKPIAFLTNGQNVPEDLLFVEPHKIAEMIVGGTDE